MKDSIVRIQKIELINFKNVKNGIIEFKNNTNNSEEYIPSSEILGVYGQNGSGKTALVNACNFLKSLLEGLPFPNDAYNYINIYSNEATVKTELYMNVQKEEYIVNYEFSFKKVDNKKVLSNFSDKSKYPYDYIVVDQFENPRSYYNHLSDAKFKVYNITFLTKAEDQCLSVACASLISRYIFLQEMDKKC